MIEQTCGDITIDDQCETCLSNLTLANEAGDLGQIWIAIMVNDSSADQLQRIYEILNESDLNIP